MMVSIAEAVRPLLGAVRVPGPELATETNTEAVLADGQLAEGPAPDLAAHVAGPGLPVASRFRSELASLALELWVPTKANACAHTTILEARSQPTLEAKRRE